MSSFRGKVAILKKCKIPFDQQHKWELTVGDQLFWRYKTQGEALADAKRYDLKIRRVKNDRVVRRPVNETG